MSNTTQVITPSQDINDEPTARLNPGRERPFAIVDLGPELDLFIHEASHARAIAAAFTKAADLLDDYAAAQAPAKPLATACPSCGTTLEPSGRCPACALEPLWGADGIPANQAATEADAAEATS